jgi:hypothetical protein
VTNQRFANACDEAAGYGDTGSFNVLDKGAFTITDKLGRGGFLPERRISARKFDSESPPSPSISTLKNFAKVVRSLEIRRLDQ